MPTQSEQAIAIIKKEQPIFEKILALNARPGTDVATIAAQELMYFEVMAQQKPELLQCTPESILLAVRSVMQKNLSLDPYAGLVYVKTRSVNIGTKQQPQYIKVLEMSPTANGLISYNRQLGRVLDYTNPRVKKGADGRVIEVSMQLLKPSHPQPRWENFTYDQSDFKKWQTASHRENMRAYKQNTGMKEPDINTLNYANPNYTNFNGGIDPEFARAKCIRHSMKKLGSNPQETTVRVYNVPNERVVDPEKDVIEEYTFSNEQEPDITDHIETGSSINTTTQDIPTSNDL